MFCFKKEIGPLLVTVWDALMDEGRTCGGVGGRCLVHVGEIEGLTWHSLWAFKDKHNPLPQKWYKSVSLPVLRVHSGMV